MDVVVPIQRKSWCTLTKRAHLGLAELLSSTDVKRWDAGKNDAFKPSVVRDFLALAPKLDLKPTQKPQKKTPIKKHKKLSDAHSPRRLPRILTLAHTL